MRETWTNDVDWVTQKEPHRNRPTDCHMVGKQLGGRKAAFPTDSKGAIRDLLPALPADCPSPLRLTPKIYYLKDNFRKTYKKFLRSKSKEGDFRPNPKGLVADFGD